MATTTLLAGAGAQLATSRFTQPREILFSAAISNRPSRAEPTIGKSAWTGSRCPFSTTIESRASRRCPHRSMSRWHQPPRGRRSRAQSLALSDVEFHRALFLPDGASITLQVIVAPGAGRIGVVSNPQFFRRSRATAKSWTLHASGKVSAQQDSRSPATHRRRVARRNSSFEAPKKSQAPTTIDSSAKTRSSTALFSKASLSCGWTIRASWVSCRFQAIRIVTSIPISFIQRFSMDACRFLEQQ